MAAGSEATEEMITSLQQAIQGKDKKITSMAEQIDNLETEKKLLENQVSNRSELGTSKDQVCQLFITMESDFLPNIFQQLFYTKQCLKETVGHTRNVML